MGRHEHMIEIQPIRRASEKFFDVQRGLQLWRFRNKTPNISHWDLSAHPFALFPLKITTDCNMLWKLLLFKRFWQSELPPAKDLRLQDVRLEMIRELEAKTDSGPLSRPWGPSVNKTPNTVWHAALVQRGRGECHCRDPRHQSQPQRSLVKEEWKKRHSLATIYSLSSHQAFVRFRVCLQQNFNFFHRVRHLVLLKCLNEL